MKNSVIQHISIAAVIFLAGLVLWWLQSYIWVTEEQKIHKIIEKSRLKLEQGSIYYFTDLLASGYRDSRGMDKTETLGILQSFFNKTKNRDIRFSNYDVAVHGEEAVVYLVVTLRIVNKDEIAFLQNFDPEALLRPMRIKIVFGKIADQWKLVQTSTY